MEDNTKFSITLGMFLSTIFVSITLFLNLGLKINLSQGLTFLLILVLPVIIGFLIQYLILYKSKLGEIDVDGFIIKRFAFNVYVFVLVYLLSIGFILLLFIIFVYFFMPK